MMVRVLFSRFRKNFRPVSRFWEIDAQHCDLAKTCSAWPENSVLYNFNEKLTVFAFWREFEASFTILRTLTLKNAIWPKRAAHDLKTAFCTIFIESALFSCFQEHLRPAWRFWKRWRSKMRFGQNVLRMKNALFSRFEENVRLVSRFWELWRSKMRFGQNVLRMTWNDRFVWFWWTGYCFPVFARSSGQCDDFENFDAQKCHLDKTCSAWANKSVFYNFYEKPTVFLFSREFQASFTILRTLTLKNAIWPKRAATDLKRAFCRIFIKSALFSFLKEFQASVTTLRALTVKTTYLAKTCCAWPEKSVLYNFHGKRTDFPSWREFEPSFTILRTMTLKSVIWPKRAPHDLKIAFSTIFIESALFSCLEENFRLVSRF